MRQHDICRNQLTLVSLKISGVNVNKKMLHHLEHIKGLFKNNPVTILQEQQMQATIKIQKKICKTNGVKANRSCHNSTETIMTPQMRTIIIETSQQTQEHYKKHIFKKNQVLKPLKLEVTKNQIKIQLRERMRNPIRPCDRKTATTISEVNQILETRLSQIQ